MVGDNTRGDREKDDFYATPPEATQALLNVEKFEGVIWEPCCGQGHISEVLISNGYDFESSDIADRGYGDRVDFLKIFESRTDNIITNPPYKNGLQFIHRALDLADKKVAMILPLRYLEGVARVDFYKKHRPARVWIFKRRISMMKEGQEKSAGIMAFAWFVWDGVVDKTEIDWI